MAGLKEPYSLDQPDTFLQLAFLALLFVSVWILWKLFRGYAVWSPLDDIPGPLRSSLWSGEYSRFLKMSAEFIVTMQVTCTTYSTGTAGTFTHRTLNSMVPFLSFMGFLE